MRSEKGERGAYANYIGVWRQAMVAVIFGRDVVFSLFLLLSTDMICVALGWRAVHSMISFISSLAMGRSACSRCGSVVFLYSMGAVNTALWFLSDMAAVCIG